jgi:hypothetical protein
MEQKLKNLTNYIGAPDSRRSGFKGSASNILANMTQEERIKATL